MLKTKPKLNRKAQKQAKFFNFLIYTYIIAFIISELNLFSGRLLKNHINPDNITSPVYKIAIIDTSFDLTKFSNNKIISPYNAPMNNHQVTATPKFDCYGNFKLENHGTDILSIFIGPNGLLPNAQMIPIQVQNYENLPAALKHAVQNGAQYINISLSFAPPTQRLPFIAAYALEEASKNAYIFIAAGNSSQALEDFPYGISMLQLAQKSQGKIFLVTAHQLSLFKKRPTKASFSNYTRNNYSYVIHAPGQNINLNSWQKPTFYTLNGTSIAAPLAIIQSIYKQAKKSLQ